MLAERPMKSTGIIGLTGRCSSVCRNLDFGLFQMLMCAEGYKTGSPSRYALIVMLRTLAIILLLFTGCKRAAAQNTTDASGDFRWLDPHKDAALYKKIKAAFTEDLKPAEVIHADRYSSVYLLYKSIKRIGIFQSYALVITGGRETPAFSSGEYFEPYSYNLKTGKTKPLVYGFTHWRFVRFARFEPSKPSDIVFTYQNCFECETYYFVGSFHLDPSTGTWSTRAWSDQSEDITIGSGPIVRLKEGESHYREYHYQCLFKIADFGADGLDGLAVRCLALGDKKQIFEDTTSLYTVEQGKSKMVVLKDTKQIADITAKLCENVKRSRLCSTK